MAFQTGCAAAGGLNCLPDVVADDEGRELVQHGSALFPIACYEENLKSYSVAWHWHEEFEYILAVKGPLAVDVSKARLVLQTGQGVFVNSGVFHAVEQAETGDALLHSGVFHPRLIGGMDTIFWQKLVHPLLQPGAPAFFLLDEADDGQKAVLCHLREVWDAVAQEVFDYENQARYHLSAAVHLLGMQCEGGKTKVSQQEQIAAQRMKQMLRFVEEHYAEELNVERISDCVALSESACLRSFRQLLGMQCEGGKTKVSQQEQIAAQRMKQMLRFVEEHYAEELNVERISDCVALSESACLRSFRQLLGITPIQYVKQYRIEKAAELLLSTSMKIGEIGADCGFSDTSYFTKTFREIKHCTPREYRQKFAGREQSLSRRDGGRASAPAETAL